MTELLQLVLDYWVHILVPMGFVIGCYLDKRNNKKLTAFWNKNMLFKWELRPDEEVTWKTLTKSQDVHLLKVMGEPGVVAHAFNPSTREAEAGGSL
ncbi:NADH dehydrogenase [ubiquinone] 1 beta subcomplex subunit 1-like [Nannospalax galili]|uniref:NADH dehydrogenase [ubiquinone] 1 beta subcomplex subunit 1-like n=1 Tax=Nannospalax galili TaxID=1026970 RepID=UPI00111C4A4A|nr:NADH dehydrogenase [ubiquinone] 1 beta subcomplex subunit 1-like [Nannospalax galili]